MSINANNVVLKTNADNYYIPLIEKLMPQYLTIDSWLNILLDDIRSGRSIEEYKITRILKDLDKEQLDYIANYIINVLDPGVYDIPPGKICLAACKDELEKKQSDFSYKHMIVLLFSIKDIIKNDGTNKMLLTHAALPTKVQSDSLVNFKKALENELPGYEINVSINKINLILNKQVVLTFGINEYISDKIDPIIIGQVADQIMRLNSFIPSRPVKFVSLAPSLIGSSMYNIKAHTIILSYDPNKILISVCHEMGHAILSVRNNYNPEKIIQYIDRYWNKIFQYSKTGIRCEIVDESNYRPMPDCWGHPYDNTGELFASSNSAFIRSSGSLIKYINDVDTPEDMRLLGIFIYCYFRDEVYDGIFIDGTFYKRGTAEYQLNNKVKCSWKELLAENVPDNPIFSYKNYASAIFSAMQGNKKIKSGN